MQDCVVEGKCKSFGDYATDVFVPFIIKQAQHTQRVDLVWDRYLTTSLKKNTQEMRGSGVRRRVCRNSLIPVNWKLFLRSDENKTELFTFLRKAFLQSKRLVLKSLVHVMVMLLALHLLTRKDSSHATTKRQIQEYLFI
jgi:hypothetical protein